ncbi:CD209 antigen-like [Patiria miniata]|uniref:C-type lectin domain-containing protein n=1 Tax=Patiria miniata TaxID=46514 RepID=A0A914B6U4_PATMI|nr:CD209 antigen-like [Patiria miniata]
MSSSPHRTAVCPGGFQPFESSCYRLVSDSTANGYAARTECQQLANDSHLAFIKSKSEMNFLLDLAKGRGVDQDYWFGLTHTNDEDHPHWLDGSPLGNFTAWDYFGVFDEHSPCVRLRRRSEYLWNDRRCDLMFGYICEVERSTDDVIPLTTPSPKAAAPPTPTVKAVGFKSGPANMAAPVDNHLLRSVKTRSLIRCAQYCLEHNACAGFNYQLDQSQSQGAALGELLRFCELLARQFSDEELVERRGYKNYRV